MSAALDRWLTRLYHAVGGGLFLGLCAIVSYAAGDRHQVAPPANAVDAPPWDRDGRPRTIETEIPADFPCGPAMPVESPSAACNGFRRTVRPQRRPDAVMPFRVTCGGVTTGPAGAKTARVP